jgi:hypothetical protein
MAPSLISEKADFRTALASSLLRIRIYPERAMYSGGCPMNLRMGDTNYIIEADKGGLNWALTRIVDGSGKDGATPETGRKTYHKSIQDALKKVRNEAQMTADIEYLENLVADLRVLDDDFLSKISEIKSDG